ncbi:FAD-dependent oxidoreductase [Clostridium sp. AL.422]|uniref:FAD-dependent oxidoreductase n=1 Tax=Clostridium TaxID=1485 RepID=UPI00293DA434|nr:MULTISPECIES: FAD-dependent oxidoreductase [unclassified Clostridium]MDV4151506.1 FAD-dependent oxidoreductase [Clostridium sp. AL.422]
MKSIWAENYKISKKEHKLDIQEADVVIIGGGIAGILTAYMLKEKNINAVILERNKVLKGNTINTTAKITIQHNIIYDKLIKEFGKENAKRYFLANQLALENYQQIISKNNIDCDFEVADAYIYTLDSPQKIEKEYEAAISIGIDAELVDSIELPFEIAKAVKFKNQANFNPIKFLNYIAKDLTIYENTTAIEIKDDVVVTDRGEIKAKSIVVATHFPIINTPGYYFLRMHQEREYVMALKNAQFLNGMYIDEKDGGYSFRRYKDYLILGGAAGRTGSNEDGGSYNKLRDLAKKLYPDSIEEYHWSAQDCITSDGIPFIGVYSKEMPNVYVATGFNKWGMTSSMVSAIIISGLISGETYDFNEIFSPSRFDMTASIKNLVKDGFETTYNFIAEKIRIPMEIIENIKNGESGVVIYEGRKVGVYKNSEGRIYTVSNKCPHLGCELKWNADDLSWDCPCHGSRFDYNGNFLESPAIKDLKYEE